MPSIPNMTRAVLFGLLALAVVCMVPLMGIDHATTGHLHHGAADSCATCMGPESVDGVVFLFAMLGMATMMVPAAPPRAPVHGLFHPPRIR